MLINVLSVKRIDKDKSTGNEMHGFFIRGFGKSGDDFKWFDKFIDDRRSNGSVIAAGDVIDVSTGVYTDKNNILKEYVESACVVAGAHFEYVVDMPS